VLSLFPLLSLSQTITRAWCSITSSGNLSLTTTAPSSFHATAEFIDSLNDNGWYQLHVNGTAGLPSRDVARCAGAVEGFLTHDRISQYFKLIFDMQDWNLSLPYPPKTRAYLSANLNFIKEGIKAYLDVDYWKEIGVIFAQFEGLVEGYGLAESSTGLRRLDEFDLWFYQATGDMEDISEIVGSDSQPFSQRPPVRKSKYEKGGHCSGLVRLLPDYSDLFFAHDSWSDFRELHGQLKEYYLPLPEFKAKRIVMSTRVGKLASYDDFYATDAGLFVLETTINLFNEALYAASNPQQIFTWLRALHASWCTAGGREWTDVFIQHNSGTYNNEYLVVDAKKFERFEKPAQDLLWIIEQYPGVYRSQDITSVLVEKGFFPSFNTPWFEDLYNLAGFPETVEEWGDLGNYWTYNTSARFYLFEREAQRLLTFDEFRSFMRYNNWKRDLYSNGDPGQMILARYDQRPPSKSRLQQRLFGGLDAKCLRLTEAVSKLHFHARASPASDEANGIPVFEFPDDYPHDGLPKRWNFSWIEFESYEQDSCTRYGRGECLDSNICGWCGDNNQCIAGDKTGPFMGVQCKGGWFAKGMTPAWVIAVSVIGGIAFVAILILAVWLITRSRAANAGLAASLAGSQSGL
jgi:hypothetical protein